MNNILDLSSSFDFNNNNVVKGEIEIDDVFELENNIEILVQDKIIEPTREVQTVTADEDYDQLGTVTVNPIPDEYIIPDGTLDVDANGDVDVTMFRMARVGVYTPPTLQDKEVIPTKEEQIISYDEDYDGLNSVIVNSIPDEYIIPTGTLNINKNGTQNVNNYDNVKVKVKSVANIGPKHLYLIKDGVEQTDITGGSAFLDMGLGTGYTSISQGNGYLGLCVAEATRSFTFANSFDYNKYTKLCVEWAYPKADNYGNYIAPTIGVKISKQPSDDSMVKTFLMHGGNTRETKPKTITELDIVDTVEGSKVNIIIGRTGYGSDFPSYPAHIYNLYLESSAINLQDKSIEVVQNGTQIITPDTDYDGLNSVEVNVNVLGGGDIDPNASFEILAWNGGNPSAVKLAEGLTSLPSCFTPKNNTSGFGAYIKKLILPNTFVRLHENLFENYRNLEEINLENVTQFYNGVFKGCASLKSITLPEGMNVGTGFSRNPNKLQHSMFNGCSNLEHVGIPSNIIGFGYACFSGCSNLIMDELPEGITEIGPGYLPSGGSSDSGSVFQNCSNITFSKLPDGLTNFAGPSNFSGCTKITISTLPDSITNLAGSTFSGCTSITTFNTNNVQKITNNEFSNCTGLVSIVMPKLIQNNASSQSYTVFLNCTALKAVWIGNAVTKLTNYTFRNCSALQKIYIDLPRATASTLAGYAKGYTYDVDNSAKVIYNDDAGFITQAEFEAIDWSNYTE